ncbi:MAG: hypothetical protein A3I66_05475 [Burkholderiales bacterium RIFCSPLOWO2_02_FULL_57_36]|nr:MAG: hypothetical protein A3I66_05475 [Burkholderiales bacterium RIFCSPLOWO2_02_FULL_57_36]
MGANMRTNRKFFLAMFLLGHSIIASAEDIDVYGGIKSDGDKPNLVILLDNAGAWNGDTSFACPGFAVPSNNQNKVVGFEQCGLYTAATAIGNAESLLGNINMGLMLFSTGSTNGGTFKLPAASPYTLPVMNEAGITAFKSVVASIDRQVDASNNSAVGAGMQEVWAYYKGATGLSGTSYSGNSASACQRNFALYIANATNNGKPQDTGSTASDALQSAGANSAQMTEINIPDPYDKYEANYGDEWARFMYQTDLNSTLTGSQNIITYTIILTDGSNPEYVEFLKSMASFGGGKYFLVTLGDLDALVQALLQIFNAVQGVNSAFASSSLPVSANTQGTFLNQVFMGVFRPDESALPRWQGNLKQYKFGLVDGTLRLVDANGEDAISSAGTGFIDPNAVSFWTSKDETVLPDSAGGFWKQKPQGASAGFDSADGEVVEKGGVHQQIRLAHLSDSYSSTPDSDSRKLYTCTGSCASGSALSSTLFASSNTDITAALLGTTAPSVNVSSISRNDSDNLATVTLAAAPDPALTDGQLVTISGAENAAFNGIFSITVVDGTHFTFPLPVENLTPITPAAGAFTVSEPGGAVSVSSLTRSETTVTATTSSSHGFTVGSTETVTITGADQGEYNATNVTATIIGSNTFTYPLNGVENPTSPGGGGTAAVGGSSFPIPASQIVRTGTNVTVTNTATGNTPPKGWAAGNSVTISGATPSGYDGTWTVTNVGNGCAGGTNNKSFCFTIAVTPVSPATGSVTADFGAVTAIPILSIERGPSTCPTSPLATVTVTTVGAHGFADGATVSIAGTDLDASESAYATSAAITTTSDPAVFTYQLALSPACTDTTSGMKAKPVGGDKDSLISWIRGKDNAADEPSPDTTYADINIRPSVHGDVLHSRPVAINYGGSTGVVVFYGSNDGVFRAINGNQVNPTGSTLSAPGSELWGFIAPEFFSRFSRLRDNSPQIKLQSTPAGITPSPQPKEYFFDGATGVYQDPGTGKVYLYLSARRGGRLIYALDVSDPAAPKFLWKHSSADTNFGELGQTWSVPKVMRVAGYTDPIVVFGAGYDPNEDAEPPLADSMGRGIFALDAFTGALVWRAQYGASGSADQCTGNPCTLSGMTYAMPSDVTALDRDRDGAVDRLYAPDLGGNIWRVDFELLAGNAPANWQVTRFAALGGTGATKRKIFYPPDVVPTNDFDAILVGTGDREHPVAAQASIDIKNRFYMIRDTVVGKDAGSWTVVEDDSSATAFATTDDLFDATTTLYDGTVNGFYLNLLGLDSSNQSQPGEKVVNAPITVGGMTFFGTNQPLAPDPNTCQADLGVARGYGVDFYTGESYSVIYDGGGLPPSPVVGVVLLDDGTPKQFCIGCAPEPGDDDDEDDGCARSSIGGCETASLVNPTRTRSYWYEK